MDRRHRLILITFIESFATILLERGLYFYTEHRLDLSEAANLTLALAFGVSYMTGALVSHPIALRAGEKRTLIATIASLLVLHVAIIFAAGVWSIAVLFTLIGLVTGMKWPVIESYVSAGHTPRNTLRILGRFNVSWAASVPAALIVVGPILETPWPWLVFVLAAAMNVAALWLVRPLPPEPVHLAADHPERLPTETLRDYRRLLASSRWTMLGSYALLFLLAPLMPEIFKDLGLSPATATVSASLLDLVRLASFGLLGYLAIWHGRALPLALVTLILPVGFFMVLFGQTLATVLVGEIVFGAAAGFVYFSAIYYAMIVKNASVDAGGVHESLIGSGFALGPLAGLIGLWLSGPLGGYVWGMLLGVAPLLVMCTVGAVMALRQPRVTPALPAPEA